MSEDADKTEMKAKHSNRERLYSSSSSNSSNSRCSVWPVGQAAGRYSRTDPTSSTAEHEHEYTHDHEGLIILSGRNSDIHI